MSRLTFSYGIAQVIPPAIVGYMAEYYGNFNNGLMLTLVIMLTGSIALIVAQRIQCHAGLTSAPLSNQT